MRLAIFGGTGRTGRRIATAARAAGHHPLCIGRSASTTSFEEGIEGRSADVLDEASVKRAIEGCDAVFLALSIPRTSRNPFAPLTGRPDLHSASAAVLIPLLLEAGIPRVIKLSAQGVGDSAPRAGWGFRALVAVSNLRPAFEDHAIADRMFLASGLEVTVLRPPMLLDAPAGPGLTGSVDGTTWTWTRVRTGDVAAYAVGCLEDPATIGKTLTLVP